MSDPDHKAAGECAGGCPGCCGHEPTPEASELSGWPFVARCVAVFLVPIATAVAGASWAGPDRVAQAAGGVAGLVLGASGVWAVSRASKPGRGS